MNTNRHAVKQPLLHLMKNDNHQQAVEAVLNSGLLPAPQLQQWFDNMDARVIRTALGRSGCPEWEEWEEWVTNRISGKDRSAVEVAAAEARVKAWVAARTAAETDAQAALRAPPLGNAAVNMGSTGSIMGNGEIMGRSMGGRVQSTV